MLSTQIALLGQRIRPLDTTAQEAVRVRQNTLTKPPGSLGQLEALSVQLAGITGNSRPQLPHKVIGVMAADHGVAAEGVSAYPQAVTAQMVLNFLAGGAAINVLARQVGARVVVIDMGVATSLPAHPGLVSVRLAPGTHNFVHRPAMSHPQAEQAVLAGAEWVEAEIQRGLDVLATGDMGIANTTASAAIAVAITGRPVETIVGRGTGVDEAGLRRKQTVVAQALSLNQPNPTEGLDVLAKVGGFEIGGLAGAMLGAAANRRPIVVDGFISTAAALIAVVLCPLVKDYLIAAHASQELGHRHMLEWLGLRPLLDLDLRLGEGSGAALALPLLDAACAIVTEMATFNEAGVSGSNSA
jgi:nicotinate-nucleotide--dimethylbenzimidazole phosphoribosyltransferase